MRIPTMIAMTMPPITRRSEIIAAMVTNVFVEPELGECNTTQMTGCIAWKYGRPI